MENIYHWLGFLIFWLIIIIIIIVIALYIYDALVKITGKNWFHYYIKRTKIDTDILRHNYGTGHKYKKYKHWIIKYRKRNIDSK